MDKLELQQKLSKPYSTENWIEVVQFVFPNVQILNPALELMVDDAKVEKLILVGNVLLMDGKQLALFELKLKPNVNLIRNRVELNNIISKHINQDQVHGVLSIFEQGGVDYRFTFSAKRTEFDEKEGEFKNIKTDTKRFTYVLGKNESCRTPAERFFELSENKTKADIHAIEDAFSVEKLSKLFFEEYNEQYEKFASYLVQSTYKSSIFKGNEKNIRDFVKLLLGRIIFIKFVQKKGWLGVPANQPGWAGGDYRFLENSFSSFQNKELFYTAFLEPLFYDTLNKPNRPGDLFPVTGTKVPYLNGGLFEKGETDTSMINFPVSFMSGLFEFFDRYNFTIDENDLSEKEVGIDPEMLGHIFENLLEDNKDKGVFYTPKEIVHYMCQECLNEYLKTQLEAKGVWPQSEDRAAELEQALEAFVKRKEGGGVIDYDCVLATALRDVKICDPAIGSGAFPMGLLTEIFRCMFILYHASQDVVGDIWGMDSWQPETVKKNIIQNSIYGVDIERGAVEIARLRFWLSLIIDEPEPHALPNLDYKIVVGNSLVSKLDDDIIDIDWEVKEGLQSNAFGIANVERRKVLLKAISTKQKLYFDPTCDKETIGHEIRDLKIDLLINQLEEIINTQGVESQPTGTDRAITQQTERYLQTLGWKQSIRKLEFIKADREAHLQFFDWKLDFSEVMNEQVTDKVGFDIVIGNPPYVGHKGGMKELFRNLKDTPLGKMFNNERMDVFYYFFHQSINLSNDKGIIGFITTNYYLTADSAFKLRKDFKERSRIIKLVNFNELKVFESAKGQHNIITFLTKNIERNTCSIININKKGFADSEHINRILQNQDTDTLYYKQNNQELFDGDKCYLRLQNSTITSRSKLNLIIEKIKASKELLGKYCNISQGIVTGIDKVGSKHILRHKEFVENKGDGIYVISQEEKSSIGSSELIKPWFKNSDIKRYFVAEKPTKWLIHTSVEVNLVDYPNIEKHLTFFKKLITSRNYESGELSKAKRLKQWWALSSSRWEFNFDAPKIVSPQRSYSNTFAYTEKSWYASADVYFISEKENGLSLKYLLGILNSRLMYFWLYNRGKRKGEMLELYLTPISEIPIKKPSQNELRIIKDLVNEILTSKKNNHTLDTTKIEIEIDNFVYKLYELTYDEVLVVEPEFGDRMSREEYEGMTLD